MNQKEVAHLWANQSRDHAKADNLYFQGDTIYSYGSHFPIARHCKGAVLFTSKSYSNTTAKHKGYVRSACSHLKVFTVASVMDKPSLKTVSDYKDNIGYLAEVAAKARNLNAHLSGIQSEVDEANAFCEHFGFKTRFEMPSNFEELKAKALKTAARERKAKAAAKARFERDVAETVQRWLAGESVSIPHQFERVLLRERAWSIMETSKGATVPLDEARKAFRFAMAMRNKGWHRNGDQFQVGDYQLDAVNEFGVIAGCHRVAWDEIERFAKLQGWL